MFIQIAPRVKVYVTDSDMSSIQKHWSKSLCGRSLPVADEDPVKKLAHQAVFVRKKLDTEVQHAVTRKIRMIRSDRQQ